ncbi:benzoate diol dehydrogenase BenD [Burkholderia guangdongensis]|uniref:benzoate diol dehydrogenase BenD n=1 Tax=Burkholderia guangdongensis TaxID=1792500 RepID=UPI0015CE5D6A|nr:benzoate diol dehydrogenase BenD [Burkholderia guangdongensis]
MSGRFERKVLAVTGAAQGIGQRVAERAAAEGARLALIDRSPYVHEIAAALVAQGHAAIALEADLESYAESARALADAHAHFQRIDVLINNVGGTIWAKPYAHYAEHEIEAEVRRSLFPTLWCCHAVLPYMLDAGGGTIVNVSSVATAGVHRVPYSAAKGGVNALTRSLAMEYADAGIRVVATAPGGTDAPPRRVPRNASAPTDQEKTWYQGVIDQTVESSLMKRYGTLDEQAGAILFLASDDASYITGTVLPVAGGDLG